MVNIFIREEADVCISYVDPKMKTIYVHRTDSRINEIMTQLNECYANTVSSRDGLYIKVW